MGVLTEEQVKEYQENGFLVVDDVFSEKEVEEIIKCMQECEPVQQHFQANPGGFGFHLLEITTKHETFLKYACHPKIVELIKPLLGEDIQLQHSKLTVKMSGKAKGEIPWHQDFAYLPHTNTSLCAVMICLVDFTPENGCMQAIKGSHKLGVLNHRGPDGFETFCSDSWAWQDESKIANVTPKRGGVSIHHCLTVHSSKDNVTNIPRSSLVFEYRARDAYQIADKVWEDTGLAVSGKDDDCLDIRLETIKIPLVKGKRYANFYGSAFNQVGKSVQEKKLISPFLFKKQLVKEEVEGTQSETVSNQEELQHLSKKKKLTYS